MTGPKEFDQSLASSEHLRTLAALMQQKGLDDSVAQDETHGGIPFTAILVQGGFSGQAKELAHELAAWVDAQRARLRCQANQG